MSIEGEFRKQNILSCGDIYYSFLEKKEIPDNIRILLEEYKKLNKWFLLKKNVERSENWIKKRKRVKDIFFILKRYEKEFFDGHRDIISFHDSKEYHLKWKGADSLVYVHKNGRYVIKHSLLSHNIESGNLKYIQNKYYLLRRLLPEYIPKSTFILGEVINGLLKTPYKEEYDNYNLNYRKAIITIQKRIYGKTLRDMTKQEKSNPDFLNKIKEAHYKYIEAISYIRSLNFECNVPNKEGLDLNLDLKSFLALNKRLPDKYIIEKVNTTNILYSHHNNRIYFIDFAPRGIWDNNKEMVLKLFKARSKFNIYE